MSASAPLTRLSALRSMFRRDGFAQSVTVLAGGTALGQAIVLLASPVLTRLYQPEEFGVLAVYASLLGIVVVFAGMRYELAVPLANDDEQAIHLVVLALVLVVLVAGCTGILILLAGGQLAAWLRISEYERYLWLLPLGVLLAGSYQVLNYWAVRKRDYSRIARTKLHQAIGSVAVQIGCGLAKLGPLGLIGGQIVGQSAGVGTLARSMRPLGRAFARVRAGKIVELGKRYAAFLRFGAPQAFINALGQHLPQLMLAGLFSSQTAGLYLLARRILNYPVQVVGQSIRQVYYPRAKQAYDQGRAYPYAMRLSLILAASAVIPTLVIALFAPPIFGFCFGEEWRQAGVYSSLLVWWLAVGFVNIPSVSLIPIVGLQRFHLTIESAFFAPRIAAIAFGAWLNSEIVAIAALACVGVVFNVLLIGAVLAFTKRSDSTWRERHVQ